MMTTEKIAQQATIRVKKWLESKPMPFEEIAKRSGVTRRTLLNLRRPGWKASIETIAKLERLIADDFDPDEPVWTRDMIEDAAPVTTDQDAAA